MLGLMIGDLGFAILTAVCTLFLILRAERARAEMPELGPPSPRDVLANVLLGAVIAFVIAVALESLVGYEAAPYEPWNLRKGG
jgi:vacuolar-type H+-ATPase subunit I/STV1